MQMRKNLSSPKDHIGKLSVLLTGVLLVWWYMIMQNIGDAKNPWVRIHEIKQKQVSTEWSNSSEIIVDNSKEIPKQSADKQDREEIESDNKEVIAELESGEKKDPGQEITADLPTEMNLAVPFFPQAPDADWSLPWKEACEEASLVLAAYYLNDQELSKEQFKKDIIAMVAIEKEMFGDIVDTNVEQTAQVFERYYGIGTTKIIDNPTVEQIKAELVQWHPIVAPFAGRELGNSFFTNGGPRYHMLVIRWYDAKYFYTNDVWTKQGKNFPYNYATIMSALHDFVKPEDGEMIDGAKRILVLRI